MQNENVHSDENVFQQVIGSEPTPELVVQLEEEFEALIELVPDPQAKQIALRKFEGFTNQEIAAELECSERTVERKLVLVRAAWKQRHRDES